MKIIENEYFVCPICSRTSDNKEEVERCKQSHFHISDDGQITCMYVKGGRYPDKIIVNFDGYVARYYLCSKQVYVND